MAQALNEAELTKALTELIEKMEAANKITKEMGKELKNNLPKIVEDLKNVGLTKEDLTGTDESHKLTQKRVMGMIITKAAGNEKTYEEFKKGLEVSKDPRANPKEEAALDKNLDNALKLAVASLAVKAAFDGTGEELKDKLGKDLNKTNDPSAKAKINTEVNNAIEKERSEAIAALNGGEDIRFPDRIEAVVTRVVGNLQGYPNLTTPDPANVTSYMKGANTYNPGKEDPRGFEASIGAMVGELVAAVSNVETATSSYSSPTPLSTTMTKK